MLRRPCVDAAVFPIRDIDLAGRNGYTRRIPKLPLVEPQLAELPDELGRVAADVEDDGTMIRHISYINLVVVVREAAGERNAIVAVSLEPELVDALGVEDL